MTTKPRAPNKQSDLNLETIQAKKTEDDKLEKRTTNLSHMQQPHVKETCFLGLNYSPINTGNPKNKCYFDLPTENNLTLPGFS